MRLLQHTRLEARRCRWILLPDQYQLLITDQLPLPWDEMAQAMRWKVKDLLEYPLEDVVLDLFPIPPFGTKKQQKKAGVVVARKSWIETMLTYFEEAFLLVETIDVADLALCHIIEYCAKTPTVALLHIEPQMGKLLIWHEGNVYLIRQLAWHHRIGNAQDTQLLLETLLEELQRSFHYCEAELKLGPIRQLLLTPNENAEVTVNFLRQHLSVPVIYPDFNDIFHSKASLPTSVQQELLYSMGGVFPLLEKQPVKAYATED